MRVWACSALAALCGAGMAGPLTLVRSIETKEDIEALVATPANPFLYVSEGPRLLRYSVTGDRRMVTELGVGERVIGTDENGFPILHDSRPFRLGTGGDDLNTSRMRMAYFRETQPSKVSLGAVAHIAGDGGVRLGMNSSARKSPFQAMSNSRDIGVRLPFGYIAAFAVSPDQRTFVMEVADMSWVMDELAGKVGWPPYSASERILVGRLEGKALKVKPVPLHLGPDSQSASVGEIFSLTVMNERTALGWVTVVPQSSAPMIVEPAEEPSSETPLICITDFLDRPTTGLICAISLKTGLVVPLADLRVSGSLVNTLSVLNQEGLIALAGDKRRIDIYRVDLSVIPWER